MKMYSFDDYTVQIYQTPEEYYLEVPDHRFVAYLREVPEASLHAYGPTHEKATRNLRELFEGLNVEVESKGKYLPPPTLRDTEEFSGRMVLRMPPWLHRLVDQMADEEGASTNSFIVNRLNRTVTMEEMVHRVMQKQENLFIRLSYLVQTPTITRHIKKKQTKKLKLLASATPKLEYNETTYGKTG